MLWCESMLCIGSYLDGRVHIVPIRDNTHLNNSLGWGGGVVFWWNFIYCKKIVVLGLCMAEE